MHAPDMEPPSALSYLRHGFSVIPLEPRTKVPSDVFLPNRSWRAFQAHPPSEAIAHMWDEDASHPSLAIICGRVSRGAYCGDIDSLAFSAWVLDNPRRAIFQNAWIVRTGSGRVHIWFRSPNAVASGKWRLGDGHIGDIKGDGKDGKGGGYVAVPPSIHPSGERYTTVAGDHGNLPLIEDGKAFLTAIARAWQTAAPGDAPVEPKPSDMRILTLDQEETDAVQAQVRGLRLKKKFADTLLVEGNQSPDSPHWLRADRNADFSYSEIDFAVVAELMRKNPKIDINEIEEIFAGTLVGRACYANKDRPHHGRSYLLHTWDAVKKVLDEQTNGRRLAVGSNFHVEEATRVDHGHQGSTFTLVMVFRKPDNSTVTRACEVTHLELISQRQFQASVFRQTQWVPKFGANYKGEHFADFAQAVADMVSDEQYTPEIMTRYGSLAGVLMRIIGTIPTHVPITRGDAGFLGWRESGTMYLRAQRLIELLQSRDRSFKVEETPKVLERLGLYETTRHVWPDGDVEPVIRLHLGQPPA